MLTLLKWQCFLCLYLFREISRAQDRLTDLLQRVYSTHPQYRELLRMILSTVGRGGEGDVGQRIRDEILVLQVIYTRIFIELSLFQSEWTLQLYYNLCVDCREIMIAKVQWWRNGIRSYIIIQAPMMLSSAKYKNANLDGNFLLFYTTQMWLTLSILAGTNWLYQKWLWHQCLLENPKGEWNNQRTPSELWSCNPFWTKFQERSKG